jgi:hypothetical protein
VLMSVLCVRVHVVLIFARPLDCSNAARLSWWSLGTPRCVRRVRSASSSASRSRRVPSVATAWTACPTCVPRVASAARVTRRARTAAVRHPFVVRSDVVSYHVMSVSDCVWMVMCALLACMSTGPCTAGSFCPEKSTSSQPFSCASLLNITLVNPNSVYCPEGSSLPRNVTFGYYSRSSDSSGKNREMERESQVRSCPFVAAVRSLALYTPWLREPRTPVVWEDAPFLACGRRRFTPF